MGFIMNWIFTLLFSSYSIALPSEQPYSYALSTILCIKFNKYHSHYFLNYLPFFLIFPLLSSFCHPVFIFTPSLTDLKTT